MMLTHCIESCLHRQVIAEYPKFYRAHEGLARVLESMGQLHRAETQVTHTHTRQSMAQLHRPAQHRRGKHCV